MNLPELTAAYLTDPDSPFHKGRYMSRVGTVNLCARLDRDGGPIALTAINARQCLRWHAMWSAGGKVAMGHAMIAMLRTVCGFGATFLEDPEAKRVSEILSGMKFQMPKSRQERLTCEQATAVRAMAHKLGFPSVALAQAFQFDGMFRQKDIIGEWVPLAEPGVSEIILGGKKWLRGIRWEEIDENLILRHVTSKRQKEVEVDLNHAPMVLEELAHLPYLGTHGPVIVDEDDFPWVANEFRRKWRMIARACGVPDEVYNMDTRSGAITEATEAGADLEHIKHAAAHSDIAMTQKYARGGQEKAKGVLIQRVEFRKNKQS